MPGCAPQSVGRCRWPVKVFVENDVGPAMRCPNLGHFHYVAALEMREHPYPLAFCLRSRLFFNLPILGADRPVHVGANELVVFNTTAVAIEGDAHAFARAIAHQRIGQYLPCTVTNVQRHLVWHGNAITEHVLVAQVARVGLARQIELAERLTLRQVEAKRVILGLGRTGITRVTGEFFITPVDGILFAIEHQVTVGKYLLRNGVEPPVHQIKMVRAFVNQQGARIFNVCMPAAEIVSTMVGVQQILKIH